MSKPVAVLHQRLSTKGQLRRLPVALPHELGLPVGTRLVGGVGSLLAPEVDHSSAVLSTLARGVPSLRLKLLKEAHASMGVPSTVKCSSESSRSRRGLLDHPAKKLLAMSCSISRAQFFAKLE
jgi:hypothetical protein